MNEFMIKVFMTSVNMSLTASFVIMVVIIARIFLQKLPRKYSYYLWAVVGARLLIPFSISSVLSIFNFQLLGKTKVTATQTINSLSPIMNQESSMNLNEGVNAINNTVVQTQNVLKQSGSPADLWIKIALWIWLSGVLLLLLKGLLSYLKLKKQVSQSVLLQENIYECDQIGSPFVLGIIKPCIYIPFRLNAEERNYILKHEQYHIHRMDHIIKLISFMIQIVHWYNPFVWLANLLMTRDMEMSCDEKVVNGYKTDIKTQYSISLLSFATNQRINMVSPLAFGETDTKKRVRHVLNIKKPKFWVGIIGILAILILGIGCLTNGTSNNTIKVGLETQPDGQSQVVTHTYQLRQQAKSYALYADIYTKGELTERKILYGASINGNKVYKAKTDLHISNDMDAKQANLILTGSLQASGKEVPSSINNKNHDIQMQNYSMRAVDTLWDDGKKHDFDINTPYIWSAQYMQTDDADQMDSFSCESLNDDITEEFHGHVNKSTYTILVCFLFSDQDIKELEQNLNTQEENLLSFQDHGNNSDETAESDLELIHSELSKWADAFCDRQGDIIVSMTSENAQKHLIDQEILTIEDDFCSFGYSSPWPMQNDMGGDDVPESLNKAYRILNADQNHAQILYYAMTSDPHYTVWREDLTYEVDQGKLFITEENLQFMNHIVTMEEFLTAYPEGTIQNTWMDYQVNGMGEQLNSNALLSSSNQYKDLFKPDTAAVSLLNLLNNPNKVKVSIESADKSSAKVLIHFEEDATDLEINMIKPYGDEGIWVVDK